MDYLQKAKEIAAIKYHLDLDHLEKSQAGQKAYLAMLNEIGGKIKEYCEAAVKEHIEAEKGGLCQKDIPTGIKADGNIL